MSLLSVEVIRFLVKFYRLNKAYIFSNSGKMFAYYVDKYLDEITNRFYFKDELDINGEICFYGGSTQISCPIDCSDIQINPITGEVRGVLLAKFMTEDEQLRGLIYRKINKFESIYTFDVYIHDIFGVFSIINMDDIIDTFI